MLPKFLFLLLFFIGKSVNNTPFEILDFSLLLHAALLKGRQLQQLFSFALLCLEGLSHSVCDGALIESLVCLDGHLDLITDPNEQEASLGAIYSYLTN